jgi:hypothetical protein
MFQYLPKLFTAPKDAWGPIRSHADAHPWSFLPVLLLLPLIPAISTYFGTAHIGWEVYGSDDTHYLRGSSAMYLGLMAYLAYLTGILIMSFMIRWVLFRTPGRPTLLLSLAFTTCLAVPLMLGGVAAALPERWMLLIIAPLAVLYTLVLLFRGLPVYMHLKRNDETRFYAACVVMVGFLVLLTTGFIFLELWWHPMTGAEYIGSPDEPTLD